MCILQSYVWQRTMAWFLGTGGKVEPIEKCEPFMSEANFIKLSRMFLYLCNLNLGNFIFMTQIILSL